MEFHRVNQTLGKSLMPGDEPWAASVKTVEALRRGLEVLQAIEHASAATLSDLHQQTRIPKATLLRMLKTLHAAGRIVRGEVESRYAPVTAPGASTAAAQWQAQFSAVAAPERFRLERRVPWPTDLAVRDGTTMLIIDAHRPTNGISVNYRVLGFRPGMTMSSLGRCYLAFCPDAERSELVAQLARSSRTGDRVGVQAESIKRLVAEGRARGYCSRHPLDVSQDSPERFGAISVPVFQGDRLIAALSCAWLPAITQETEVASRWLGALRQAAQAIGERARAVGLPPPPRDGSPPR
jgi:IclR family mhp operon transcriptional activator